MTVGRGNTRLRSFDRYFGIPLVFAAGAIRSKRTLPANPSTVGLLNTAAIGDTVLMSAVVADLREQYPLAVIKLLAGPSNYHAAAMIEGVDAVVKLKVFNPMASLQEMRRHQLDMLFDFGPWSRLNALLSIFSGAKFVVGFRTGREHRHYGYDIAVDHGAEVHELENHRRLVRAIGVGCSHMPRLRTGPASASELVADLKPFIVLHMWPGGSGAELKEWPSERWQALATDFAKSSYHFVLTGSPDQRVLNETFISSLNSTLQPRVKNVAGSSLADTASILSRASLIVSVNTGVMHMAAVTPVPLVALHGPTNARRWGPVSEHAISVESPLEGCGYLNLGFEYPRKRPPECMKAISTGMVIAACQLAMERFARADEHTEHAAPEISAPAVRWVCSCTRCRSATARDAPRRGETQGRNP